jgi:urea transporter
VKNSITFLKAIINTYAILFFSQNKVLGIILLLVSFYNPVAGASGLACAIFSLAITQLFNFQADTIQAGIYSFNSLLLGLAFGAFYQLNLQYIIWLTVTCFLVIMVSIILANRLGKLGLPILSLPFILCFWVLLLSSGTLFNIGLLSRNSLVLQEIYGNQASLINLHNYLSINLPSHISLFFRALSAILFQDNIITGILIGIGLLIHSRIAFGLLVISFFVTLGFNHFIHIYPDGISYYHLGANFMMSAMAIGSFFIIPSIRSYILAVICMPILFILINASTGILAAYNLPVFSLPFCIVNITLLYFLLLRTKAKKLQLVGLQHYSPERNLYQFINQQTRLADLKHFRFSLPFMGSWTVSQGYDGKITHNSDWSQALDFVIEDDDKNTFKMPGILPEHFYCFNKPVLACGDGVVVNVINHVEDNAIGDENRLENWGNTVVIKHLSSLYSKVSHLKKNSIKVKPGEHVTAGELLGLCGNSGRSPEPHLHFQLQGAAYIDAKTLSYPFAYYLDERSSKLKTFAIPSENETIKSIDINPQLKKAFDFQPGYVALLMDSIGNKEIIEVFTDAHNQSYFYSKARDTAAYFINDGSMFYFISFYGDEQSLLYSFYKAAYKVVFSINKNILINDTFPVNLTANKAQLWLQDIVAPFFQFIKLRYKSSNSEENTIIIKSECSRYTFGKEKKEMKGSICVANNSIQAINVQLNSLESKIEWTKRSIY